MPVPSKSCWPARTLGVVLAAMLGICGCGGSTGPTCVMGDVTFDGQPVPEGTIIFTPVEGTLGPSTGGNIKDGRYDVPADKGPLVGGTYKVEITAQVKTGKTMPNIMKRGGPPLELFEQYIPSTYNKQSILRITPKAGTNRFDFRLDKQGPHDENRVP